METPALSSARYSLAGLSARGLRVLLARNDSTHARTVLHELWYTTPPYVPGDGWLHAQLLYSEPQPHRVSVACCGYQRGRPSSKNSSRCVLLQLLLEASCMPASEPTRAYRGHVAVDAVALVPGEACPMPLACTFAAGLCRWANAKGDDFDWSLVGKNSPPSFISRSIQNAR